MSDKIYFNDTSHVVTLAVIYQSKIGPRLTPLEVSILLHSGYNKGAYWNQLKNNPVIFVPTGEYQDTVFILIVFFKNHAFFSDKDTVTSVKINELKQEVVNYCDKDIDRAVKVIPLMEYLKTRKNMTKNLRKHSTIATPIRLLEKHYEFDVTQQAYSVSFLDEISVEKYFTKYTNNELNKGALMPANFRPQSENMPNPIPPASEYTTYGLTQKEQVDKMDQKLERVIQQLESIQETFAPLLAMAQQLRSTPGGLKPVDIALSKDNDGSSVLAMPRENGLSQGAAAGTAEALPVPTTPSQAPQSAPGAKADLSIQEINRKIVSFGEGSSLSQEEQSKFLKKLDEINLPLTEPTQVPRQQSEDTTRFLHFRQLFPILWDLENVETKMFVLFIAAEIIVFGINSKDFNEERFSSTFRKNKVYKDVRTAYNDRQNG